MQTNRSLRGIFLFFLLPMLFSPDAGRADPGEGSPVHARLLADVVAVAPGSPFRLGVELRMAEGWHVYWAFAGEVGLPTRVEWRIPQGFRMGELQWPLPRKYEDAFGMVSYGYERETLLMAQVQAPEELEPGRSVEISARVSWLACRETCVPGDTSLTLLLPVAPVEKPASRSLFARYVALLPDQGREVRLEREVSRDSEEIRVDLQVEGGGLELEEGSLDFYPLELPEGGFRVALVDEGSPGRLRLILRPQGGEAADSLKGVLVYRSRGGEGQWGRTIAVGLKERGGLPRHRPPDPWSDGAPEKDERLALYLFLAAVGGLILNLMPCVLPVISLKVLGFVSQAGEEPGRIRWLGLAFSAGIVASFLLFALAVVLIKQGGEQIGWGFQFQYPGFVVAMSALIFALGLSLFGLFEIRLPGWGAGGGRGGLTGSFLNGMLATVLATPCTAPFLGAALGFAFAQSALVIGAVFGAAGAGMALPYALLALRPGWIGWLPRPGAWMDRFKQAMGFLLMGTVLWLLEVLGRQLGVEGVVRTGAFLLCLAVGCWLVGKWIDLRSGRRRRVGVWTAALAVSLGGYLFFAAPALREGTVPPARGELREEGLVWQPFSAERLEELLAEGRTVFVDFTAEWCWTCKVNERTALSSEEVHRRFAEMDVALLKADWTRRNPEITRALRSFGRSGVPLYVIFPAGRPDHPLILPELISAGVVLEKLEEAERLAEKGSARAEALE